MLAMVFWLGTALGIVAGLIHAYSLITASGGAAAALYRALWALALWILFGGYLFILWIIAVVLKALFSRARAAQTAS